MTRIVNSQPVPDDNSHLPLTIKPGGEAVQWSDRAWDRKASTYVSRVRQTADTLLDQLVSPGHQPTLTLRSQYSRPKGTLKCSCGFENSWVTIKADGSFGKGVVHAWQGHKETLAAPVLVWESQGPRARYKCYVASDAQMSMFNTGRVWGQGFHIFRQSTHAEKVRWFNSRPTIEEAIRMAIEFGHDEEKDGRTVTWHEQPVVAEISTSAADLVVALSQANTVPTLLTAIRQADEFLGYADLVRDLKKELQERLDAELGLTDD